MKVKIEATPSFPDMGDIVYINSEGIFGKVSSLEGGVQTKQWMPNYMYGEITPIDLSEDQEFNDQCNCALIEV